MNDLISAAYSERLRRVCDHIERHLDEPLSIEALSRMAHSSPFHFHRQFTTWSGLPLYRYIQWLRLRRASWRLAFNPQDKVIDIALDAGFQNPESFTRAFKTAFWSKPAPVSAIAGLAGLAPSAFLNLRYRSSMSWT
ncbi:Transcriptional regulator, AraC [Salmonella enterica subsp. enterica]|nr:Transcriptional regulator, AraC [Salmonella enterica subsp. enterica]